ncbi:MAG: 50S ribosomal protein L29 [Gammaproteobacteria bacterium]|nr:50S ribosomal protein L29 [Gammaproteobacteria bacterium]MCI0590923.1 50S ribosomal protein L29 [Gammaproteobacteria bacterium]
MQAISLRNKKLEELQSLLLDLHREKFNLRMQNSAGQLSKHTQLRAVRRDIARVKTILNERTVVDTK